MTDINSEINFLHLRLALLEKQKQTTLEKRKQIETEPMIILEDIINKKRQQIDRNSYSKNIPLARFYDQETLGFLEPIFYMLKNIQERLEILENKK